MNSSRSAMNSNRSDDISRRDSVSSVLDFTEAPFMDLDPSEDVYSYFMFVAPTEKKKEGTSRTLDTLIAYILVFLNVFFQAVLLYAVFDRVVLKTSKWRSEITDFGGAGANPIPKYEFVGDPRQDTCNDGSSLCVSNNGVMTCAPPSVQLTARWDELDLDGDGYWTKEEVLEAREELKCKYVVDPLEAFEVFRKTVLNRQHIIWVHPDLREGKAIHQTYFTYATGDIIMCGYRDEDMCGNVMSRGFFDAALEFSTVPRVGNTTDSAFHYCRELLKPGGFCEVTLPSTYSVWKVESSEECGAQEFEGTVYKHPKTQEPRSFLVVDYEARMMYERTQVPLFKVFLFIILSLWFMGMVFELKGLILVFAWIRTFPNSNEFPEGEDVLEDKDGDDVTYVIRGIDSSHRFQVLLLALLRLAMLAILTIVGTSLLLKSPSYMDLVMDAVSLVFIIEIASLIYCQVLRPQIRSQVECLSPMSVQMVGVEWLNKRQALLDMLWLFTLMAVVVAVMWLHYEFTIEPLYEALKCTCLKIGDQCHEAQAFDYNFWHDYWKVKTPEVFQTVKELRAALPRDHPARQTGPLSGSPAPAAAAAVHMWAEHVPIQKHHVHSMAKHLKKHAWLKGPWTNYHSLVQKNHSLR